MAGRNLGSFGTLFGWGPDASAGLVAEVTIVKTVVFTLAPRSNRMTLEDRASTVTLRPRSRTVTTKDGDGR